MDLYFVDGETTRNRIAKKNNEVSTATCGYGLISASVGRFANQQLSE